MTHPATTPPRAPFCFFSENIDSRGRAIVYCDQHPEIRGTYDSPRIAEHLMANLTRQLAEIELHGKATP